MYSLYAMVNRQTSGLDPAAIQAVLFDLDGTLMDTDDQAVERLARKLDRLGCPRSQLFARYLVMMAETPINLLMTSSDALGLDGHLLGLWTSLRGLGRARPPEYRLMTGAAGMLADLRRRYRLAVVTTRGREAAEAFLARHDLCGVFDAVVTREATWRLKPHPEPIREAARRLGVPVERCVMVGDTTVDVRSARRAGARAVALACGFGERGELEKAGADVLLEHVSALSTIL